MNTGNLALTATLENRIADLGNVPLSRIRTHPSPGSATIEDVIRVRYEQGKFCELIDGTLVEKAIGYRESILTGVLVHWLLTFCQNTKHGIVTGPDGMFRLFGDTIRAPAVAFTSWNRLPGRRIPKEPIPDVTPNVVVEVLRTSNSSPLYQHSSR